MSKMNNQVLIIEPKNELKFKVDFSGRFEEANTTYMQLTNPSADTVLFKIKTTAPKKYCVRPNSGLLKPNSKIEIAITPQPVFVESNEKNKHKFMVQSVIAPEGKTNIDQVWKEISADQLMDYKLRCVFETPLDAGKDAGDNEVNDSGKQLSAATEAKSAAKKTGVEMEMAKITAEMARYKEEDTRLRHENERLKEDLLRMFKGNSGGEEMSKSHEFSQRKYLVTYKPIIVTAVAMVIVGFLVGKFFM